MKELIDNYQALFDYYLELRSEYFSLLGISKKNVETKSKMIRLKSIMDLNRKQLIELDEKILFYSSTLLNCPCVTRWIEFNNQEKEYRNKIKQTYYASKEGLIQNSYIRELIIKQLLEKKDYEQK